MRYEFDDKTPEQIDLNASVGTPIIVALRGYETAGYRWRASSETEKLVSKIEALAGVSRQAGAKPGTERRVAFQILPTTPGQFRVRLTLQREGEAHPAKTHLITVNAS